MRKVACILGCLLTAQLLCGCSPRFLPRSEDISEMKLVRTLAVDNAADKDLKVTVSSGIEQLNSGSGVGGKPLILNQEADTVFSACQMIQKSGSGYVTYGHVTEFLVGKQAAEAGIDRMLDFIQRNYEMRLDTMLFLAEGEAAEVVTKSVSKEMAATDRLQELERELPLESKGWPCNAGEFLTDLYDNNWAMMPVVKLEREEKQVNLKADGMAVFGGTKLHTILDQETSWGACLLANKGKMSYLDIKTQNGGVAGLMISGQDCQWEAQWEGDQITSLTANIQIQANISEVSEDLGKIEEDKIKEIEEMEQSLARVVNRAAVKALQQEQQLGDFLHLERTLAVQHPLKVRHVREHWEQWLEQLSLQVNTTCVIQQSYDVS